MGFNIFVSGFFTALSNGRVSAILSFLRTLVFIVGGNFTAPPPVGDQRGLALHPVCRIAGRRRVRLLSGKAETKLQLLTQTAGPLMEAGCFIACPDTNNDVAVYLERKYMYSWHLIMPLYSLRRLSAGRPKISSKFSWGLMM